MAKSLQTYCEYCYRDGWRETEVTHLFRHYQANDACDDCARAYFGHYDPENPALMAVIESIREQRKLRWKSARTWDEKEALARLRGAYGNKVRSLSRRNVQRQPALLNPKKLKIGKMGQPGTNQIDHIVPVILCWEHYVSPEDAAHPANLQVIPRSINMARSCYVGLDLMIGWPYAPLHLWNKRKD